MSGQVFKVNDFTPFKEHLDVAILIFYFRSRILNINTIKEVTTSRTMYVKFWLHNYVQNNELKL